MKIILLNTSEERGGAAIACNRLMHALNKNGIEAKMIVRDKQTDDSHIISVNSNFLKKNWNFVNFVWERLTIIANNRFSKKNLFKISIANTGNDISQHPLVKEADIIHLHWINQGFLSLKNIEKLTKLGKPVVWTMHDMWPVTGICHHSRDCNKYHNLCHNCFFIQDGQKKYDLSYKIFQKKQKMFSASINFVTCSQWLYGMAIKSKLMINKSCTVIPNPIDTTCYIPKDKNIARNKLPINISTEKLILFGAAKITDKRKGIEYMIEACRILQSKYRFSENQIGIIVFGENSSALVGAIPFKVYPLNYLSNSEVIINLYNAVDLYITPSLEENLPNTIMEAMSCGTPCVGFNIGGIPEMIDHKVNGYVAEYKNEDDLASGIQWILNNVDYAKLSLNARKKVEDCYSENTVFDQYTSLYKSLLSEK